MDNHLPFALFLIDLDNTLIYTDRANNLAYEKAIKDIFPSNQGIVLFNEIKKNSSKRITREILSNISSFDKNTINHIITLKEHYYDYFLFSTISNQEKIDEKINDICRYNNLSTSKIIKIMVTNCSTKRADSLLGYHNLTTYFSQIIYCNSIHNKFDFALSHLSEQLKTQKISLTHIFIFDDDINQIKSIFSYKIPTKNICLISGEQNV